MRYRKQLLILSGLVFVISLLVCLILVFAPSRVGEFRIGAENRFQDGKARLKKLFTSSRKDPADVWLEAFTLLHEGKTAEGKGADLLALERYNKSLPMFDALARKHPKFYPELVRFRREELRRSKRDLLDRLRAAGDSSPILKWEEEGDPILDWNTLGR